MTIVVVAYTRFEELKLLLRSLDNANYLNDSVDLVISIDYGDNQSVVDLAQKFKWKYGNKNVIVRKENLGLRKHVLFCGDLTKTLGDIILLEDDLFVSPEFYRFSKEAMACYRDDENIAGVSLYLYNLNEYTRLRPFSFLSDSSDSFFMKIPSSWGQVWTANQWKQFRNWYNNNLTLDIYHDEVPDKVLSWSDASWKKYFAVYIAVSNKYFVYPKCSLSTNMGSRGTHNRESINTYQVELSYDFKRRYSFNDLSSASAIKYDAFFESETLKEYLENEYNSVEIDYYGTKKNYKSSRYLVSTKSLNYTIVKEWELTLKPYELNVINDIKGKGLYLYDLTQIKSNNTRKNKVELIKYEVPFITKEKALRICLSDYSRAVVRKLKKLILKKRI